MVYVPSGEYSIYTQAKKIYQPYIPSGEYSIYTQAPAGTYKPGGSTYTAPTATATAAPTATPTVTYQQQSSEDYSKSYYDWLKSQEEARQRAQQNGIIAVMREFMASNGMGELMAGMEKYVRMGYTGDAVYLMLKNDAQYQAAYAARFSANAARAKAGLAELSPATYIEMEQGYRSVMMAAGLPSGLFDSTDDFTRLIAADVSVKEVASRVDSALEYINYSGNAAVKQQLRDLYGMTDGQMAAYVLDPTKTLDYLQREMTKNLGRASVGGAAANSGVGISGGIRDQIAEILSYGSDEQTYAQSMEGFAGVAQEAPLYEKLALLSDTTGSAEDLAVEKFNLAGAGEVTNKKKVLASQERARFGGASGLGSTSLSAGRKAQ